MLSREAIDLAEALSKCGDCGSEIYRDGWRDAIDVVLDVLFSSELEFDRTEFKKLSNLN